MRFWACKIILQIALQELTVQIEKRGFEHEYKSQPLA